MQPENGFLERIKKKGDILSPKQRQLARYILDNYKTVAFQKLTQIAREAGVSEATVVRFTTSLGYAGFHEMIEDLQKTVQHELSVVHSLKSSLKEDRLKNLNILETVIKNEQININKLVENVSVEDIEKVVDIIEESEKVYVVGLFFSSYLAEFTGYTLGKVKPNVNIINSENVNINNYLLSCNDKTTVILFSFPRYIKKLLQLGELFRQRSATVIGITDSILSPIRAVSDHLLLVPLTNMSFTDPCSSILLLIQAIILEYIARNPARGEENLRKFDDYLEQMGVF